MPVKWVTTLRPHSSYPRRITSVSEWSVVKLLPFACSSVRSSGALYISPLNTRARARSWLYRGWLPVSKSTIARRRMPMATCSFTSIPQPSGPRWTMTSSIRERRSRSGRLIPAMPHMTPESTARLADWPQPRRKTAMPQTCATRSSMTARCLRGQGVDRARYRGDARVRRLHRQSRSRGGSGERDPRGGGRGHGGDDPHERRTRTVWGPRALEAFQAFAAAPA